QSTSAKKSIVGRASRWTRRARGPPTRGAAPLGPEPTRSRARESERASRFPAGRSRDDAGPTPAPLALEPNPPQELGGRDGGAGFFVADGAARARAGAGDGGDELADARLVGQELGDHLQGARRRAALVGAEDVLGAGARRDPDGRLGEQ